MKVQANSGELLRYASIITASPQPVLVVSPDGTIVATNHSAETLFGYGTHEMTGARVSRFLAPESAAALDASLKKLRRRARPLRLEITTKTKAGRRAKMRILASSVHDDNQTFLGVALIVSPRARQRGKAKAPTGFTAIIRTPREPGTANVPSAEIATWTDSAAELFGYDDCEIIGKNISILVSDDAEDDLKTMIAQTLATASCTGFMQLARHRSGRQLETMSEAIPVHDTLGEVIGLVARVKNLADSRAKAQKRKSTRSSTPTFVANPAGTVISWSDQAAEIFRLSASDAVGRPIEQFLREGSHDQLLDLYGSVASGKEAILVNRPIELPAGSRPIPSLRMTATSAEDGTAAIAFSVGPRRNARPEEQRDWFSIASNLEALAGIGTWSLDVGNGREYFFDAQARRMLGFEPDERLLPGMVADHIHPDDVASARSAMHHSFGTGEPLSIDARVVVPDGPTRWVRAIGSYEDVPGGNPTRFLALLVDVTEDHLRISELNRMRRTAELLFAESAIGAQSVDRDRRIVVVNDAMLRILGYSREQYLGRKLDELSHPDDRDWDMRQFAELLAGDRLRYEVPKRFLRADATYVSGRLHVAAVRNASGEVVNAVCQFLDETAIQSVRDELRFLSLYDPLTSLPKWPLFLDHVGYEISWAKQTNRLVGVAVIDIDRFARVNDEHGNQAGDAILVAVKDRLYQSIDPADSLGRLEGDTFLVLCSEMTDPTQMIERARVLAAMFEEPFSFGDNEIHLTASIGVTLAERDSVAERVIRDAELALQRAKERGGGRWVAYEDSLRVRAQVRASAEAGIRTTRSAAVSWSSTTSRSPTWRPASTSESKRCCAGTIPSVASRSRTSSSKSPSDRGLSSRSATGCLRPRCPRSPVGTRSPSGRSRCRSTSRSSSSSATTLSPPSGGRCATRGLRPTC